MPNLFKYVNLLKNFASCVLVLDIRLVNTLYCDVLSRKLVDSQCNLAEGSLAQQLNKFIEL